MRAPPNQMGQPDGIKPPGADAIPVRITKKSECNLWAKCCVGL